VVMKPQEYVNVSGPPVQRIAAFYGVAPPETVVIHDELDLPFGWIKVKVGGGHGGHNGLRSISGTIGPDYARVRCGVGRPHSAGDRERVIGHVLGPFARAEAKQLPCLIDRAADAVETIIARGAIAAMNRFNAGPAEVAGGETP